MKLVSCVTGEEIPRGRTLHGQIGRAAGQVWRYDRITLSADGVHLVKVSRCGGKLGRIRAHFHPSYFGCEISVEITWRTNLKHSAVRTWAKVDDYLWAGFFALVPLAFFEHYHWSEFIISILGMDDH
ncbi:hypothetical protein [Streptomyces humi]